MSEIYGSKKRKNYGIDQQKIREQEHQEYNIKYNENISILKKPRQEVQEKEAFIKFIEDLMNFQENEKKEELADNMISQMEKGIIDTDGNQIDTKKSHEDTISRLF